MLVLFGVFLVGIMYGAWDKFSPYNQVFKGLLINSSGDANSSKYFEVSWNLITAYSPMYDGSGGRFITWGAISNFITGWALSWYLTGYTETDPIFISLSGTFYKATNPSGYTTLDYITGNYYDMSTIDGKLWAFAWWLIYKWVRDMSTWSYPSPMNTGDFYKISWAGTGAGQYFATGDNMIANSKHLSTQNASYWDRIVNVQNPEYDPIFMANSGVYFNLFSWTYFNLNSWTYYNLNPAWYITGWALIWYITWSSIKWIQSWNDIYNNNTGTVNIGSGVVLWNGAIRASLEARQRPQKFSIYGGSDAQGSGTITNLTNKSFRVAMPSYWSDTELWVGVIGASSTSSSTTVNFWWGLIWASATNNIWFYTSTSRTGDSWTSRMTIDSGGNVGIGTQTPTEKLVVSWNIKILSWTIYDEAGYKYITGTITTGIVYPWVDTKIPTEKAVATYAETWLQDLGDVITTGYYYVSGSTAKGRLWLSGGLMSLQYLSWLSWIEQNDASHDAFYVLLSGNQTLTGQFKINNLVDNAGNKYLTWATSYWNYVGWVLKSTIGTSYNFQVGLDSNAAGTASIAIGENAYTTSDYSTSIWYSASANGGQQATALGAGATANGESSTAIWYSATAIGTGSTAIGLGAYAPGENAMAFGSFNVGIVWAAFEFGIGTSPIPGSQKNAMIITKTWYVGIGTNYPVAKLEVAGDTIFGNYLSGNYTKFDGSWFMQSYWDAIVWNDIVWEMYEWSIVSYRPSLVAMNWWTIELKCFDGAGGITEIFGRVEKPHNATDTWWISPHLHWLPETNAGGTGVIHMTYSFIEPGKLPTTPVTITGIYNVGTVAWSWFVTDIDWDLYDSWVALWTTLVYRVWRNSTDTLDTYSGKMCITQIGLHYRTDRRGSRQERVR